MSLSGNWVSLSDAETVATVTPNFVVSGILSLTFTDKISGAKLFPIMNKMTNPHMRDLNYVLALYMAYYLMHMH